MIPLVLDAVCEAEEPYVTRLVVEPSNRSADNSLLVERYNHGATFSGIHGLISVDGATAPDLDGDVVLLHPSRGRLERLLRSGSDHNTLLVTERCDQLCVMCSQPPKKTHVDRFDLLERACILAAPGMLIGISGGEPTLYKQRLFELLERVLDTRDDLAFHVLTNGQHFDAEDERRLRDPVYRRVSWGIPIYASEPRLHDEIVGKRGAFARLEQSLAHLIMASGRVELRTVVLKTNMEELPALSRYISARLQFAEAWSVMQLENIGFAKGRWPSLYFDHSRDFEQIATALDHALLHGVRAQLFNFPYCTVPSAYRSLAVASISDWKRKYAPACEGCAAKVSCCGFFEWHPEELAHWSVMPI